MKLTRRSLTEANGQSILTPGATYTVRIMARDVSGNETVWNPQTFDVTLPTSDPVGTGSTWADVNGDGLRDELIAEGGASYDFNSFPAETGHEFVSTVTWNWPTYFWFGIPLPDQDRSWTFFLSGLWQPLIEFGSYEVDLVRPGYQFRAEPGYEYSVVSKLTLQNGTTAYATLIPRTEFVPASALASAIQQEILLGSMIPVDMLNYSPITLARIALPPSGVQVNLPVIGNVTLRAGTGGVTGSVVLPGNIRITAGNGSATISAPGTGTVTVHSNGTVTGTADLPGGWVIGAASNGSVGISNPNGVSISTGPGGTTLGMPGGTSVTLDGMGRGKRGHNLTLDKCHLPG